MGSLKIARRSPFTTTEVVPLTADEICHGFMALDNFDYCECYDDNEPDGLLRVRVRCRRSNRARQCNMTQLLLEQAEQTDEFFDPFPCQNVMFETLVAPYIVPPDAAMVIERAVSCTTTYRSPEEHWQVCVVMEATKLSMYNEIRQVRATALCFKAMATSWCTSVSLTKIGFPFKRMSQNIVW